MKEQSDKALQPTAVNGLAESKKIRAEHIASRIFTKTQKNAEKKCNEDLTVQIENLKAEISSLKNENNMIKTVSALEKAGCLKPELVAKEVPDACEDLQEWISKYKDDNAFLFNDSIMNHGGNYKPTQSSNLSPVEIMNNYIRGIY